MSRRWYRGIQAKPIWKKRRRALVERIKMRGRHIGTIRVGILSRKLAKDRPRKNSCSAAQEFRPKSD